MSPLPEIEVALERHAPRARCHACGNPAIQALCHHCGRALCGVHAQNPVPEGWGIHNPEFEGLGLEAVTGTSAAHCAACVHGIRSYVGLRNAGLALAALGLPLLGLAWLFAWHPAWLAWLPAGAGLVLAGVAGWLQATRHRRARLAARPPLPVLPELLVLEINETLAARASLDAHGVYSQSLARAEGRLTATLRFRPQDRERIAPYRLLHGLPPDEALDFRAGFLLLEGALSTLPGADAGATEESPNVLALQASTAEHAYLATADALDDRWLVERRFTLAQAECADLVVPLAVSATLVPGESGRVLELALLTAGDARSRAPWGALQEPLTVEELRLELPRELGRGEGAEPALVWQDVPFTTDERAAGQKSFLVRLERPPRSGQTLRGRVRVRFGGALSGLEGVRFFDCLGQPAAVPRPGGGARTTTVVKTTLELEFSLALQALSARERQRDERRSVHDGVAPDGAGLARLLTALEGRGFYAKRVVANPARVGAHVVEQAWEIAGRAQDGLAPLDFRLVLCGEREAHGDGRALRTTVASVVHGLEDAEGDAGNVASLGAELALLVQDALLGAEPSEREFVLVPQPPGENGADEDGCGPPQRLPVEEGQA